MSWPLLAVVASAQVDEPVKPAPAEPAPAVTPAELRAGMVLKIAGYLTPERTPTPTPTPSPGPTPTPPPTPAARKPAPFRIGLLGKDDVTAIAHKAMTGKSVGTTTATVVQLDTLAAIEGHAAEHCDLLYVADSIDDKVLARVLRMHADKPMPIVCERAGFASAGGAIQLFVDDKDLRFEVNAEALKQQGIKASPQLLKHSRKGPGR